MNLNILIILVLKFMITAAQIKKGSTFLISNIEDMLLQIIDLPMNKFSKPVKFTFYQCINTLVDIFYDFIKSPYQVTLNIFIVDWHVKKYEKDHQIYRHFIGLTHALKKFIDTHEDAKLFLSLFSHDRNSKEKIKWFLKLRKTILKTINPKILAQISVTHSDAITIGHILYQDPLKSKMIKKINDLFINLKRKLINTAKIDGAVACQFFLKAQEEILELQLPLKPKNTVHNTQQGKYPSYPCQNVSFSDEFPDFTQKNKEYKEYDEWKDYKQENQEQICDEWSNQEDLNLQSIEEEWNHKQNLLKIKNNKYMESLKILSQKDKGIDARLQDSGFYKIKKFPQGWQQFLRTNKMMKEKLLNRRNY